MRPSVFIIGAGPGAPDLLTLRGLRALQSAQVVIYDRRIPPRLLDFAPISAERIDVGSAAPHGVEQDAINFLLAEKAREGTVVARLKWGDPFVFDNGGAEALFLHEQRIAFEVIPGVPALVAAPAFAGVPLTYPGSGDTITFIRGFEDDGRKEPAVDWASLARLDGTLACFAGRQLLTQVITSLLAHGRSPLETSAFIVQGTLSAQKTVAAPLGEMLARVDEAGLSGPGILVIGSVAGLRDHLRW
ncbi:MAG: uroporphyrinogen-III C-methyltransferase [Vicinamibacterales bacterium]